MEKETPSKNVSNSDQNDSNQNEVFYFSISKNGKRHQISKEKWEKEWLDWYNKDD